MVGNYFVESIMSNNTMFQKVCRDDQMTDCDESGPRFIASGTCLIDTPSMNLTFDAKLVLTQQPNRNETIPDSNDKNKDDEEFKVGSTIMWISVGIGSFIMVLLISCAAFYFKAQRQKYNSKPEVPVESEEDKDLMIMYLESLEENKKHQY